MKIQEAETSIIYNRRGPSHHRFPEQKYSAFRPTPTSPLKEIAISIDGKALQAHEGELLIDAILREKDIPHICYHSPLMGSIQTCDTCIVEVDGQLVRACGTKIE